MIPHFYVLVEEPSMEAYLLENLPSLLEESTFSVHAFQGKDNMIRRLPDRLRGFSHTLQPNEVVVVMLDRDDDDCVQLKEKLLGFGVDAGLNTSGCAGRECPKLIIRIVVEELEAWYFGDWEAVCEVYPRMNPNVPRQAAYRNSDQILGGTWEAFERLLRNRGYHTTGLRKTEAARLIGKVTIADRNTSPSYKCFHDGLRKAENCLLSSLS